MVDTNPRQRVVVVDDNPAFLGAAEAFLRTLDGVELVGTAPDGALGLALVLEVRPDTAIVDVSMPGMSGLELAARLAGAAGAPAIILASLDVDQGMRREAQRLGVEAVLPKADLVRDLPAVLQAIGGRRAPS